MGGETLFVLTGFMASQRDLELIQASAAGNLDRMRSLFGRGAKANIRLKNGATPLLAAAVEVAWMPCNCSWCRAPT